MLTKDISSPMTPLFLGKDVTLDLNGYTIRYADGNYENIPNAGFEEDAKGWDLSRAPGARVVNTRDVHVFIGEKIMQLMKGDEITSGIEIYVHKYIEIFNNVIKTKTSPPTCEYGHEEYSTAAIRLADYRVRPGAPNGCYGNKVYNNKIYVTALQQEGFDSYLPMAWAIYYSASGGDNEIFGNEIVIDQPHPDAKVLATAFYICGGTEGFGGRFYNNIITTNVPAAWVATLYGGAANSKIFDNTIIKAPDAPADFKPIRMGWSKREDVVAKNIEFRSNEVSGSAFDIARTDQDHSYTVYWRLAIQVSDKCGHPVGRAAIVIRDQKGHTVFSGAAGRNGVLTLELPEYSFKNGQKDHFSPYTVSVGKTRKEVDLKGNQQILLRGGK